MLVFVASGCCCDVGADFSGVGGAGHMVGRVVEVVKVVVGLLAGWQLSLSFRERTQLVSISQLDHMSHQSLN